MPRLKTCTDEEVESICQMGSTEVWLGFVYQQFPSKMVSSKILKVAANAQSHMNHTLEILFRPAIYLYPHRNQVSKCRLLRAQARAVVNELNKKA